MNISTYRRRRYFAPVVLALALCASLVAISPWSAAGAGDGKQFTLNVTPGSVNAGSRTTFTATFAAPASNQQTMGSANLTAPTGFKLVSASVAGPATAAVAGNTVELRTLGLAPNTSVAITVVADVPCGAASSAWTVQATQSNQFNGPPGNAFTLVAGGSALGATVSGSCALRYVAQPTSAQVGQTVTATRYTPTGPPVSVEVIDGGGNRVTSSASAIKMTLIGSGSGPLTGTATVNASSGLATFSDLKVGSPGTYSLVASSLGLTSATSNAFRIDTIAVVCVEDLTCTGTASTAETKVSVTANPMLGSADAGFLTLSFNVGPAIDCAGYQEFSSDIALIDVSADRTKTIAATIDKKQMNKVPNNGASFLQACFGSPVTFTTASGAAATNQASYDWDGNGVLDPVYVGLLPNCGPAAPPCVSARKKTGSGDGYVESRLPSGLADPFIRH